MAEIQLRLREDDDWKPEHNGIDWLAKRMKRLGEAGLQAVELWFIIEEEDGTYELQITQENATVEMNYVEPAIDCVALRDPRDGLYWAWYRGEMAEETFNEHLSTFAPFAARIHTMYPRENTSSVYLARQERRLQADLEAGLDGLSHGEL
jgi:hypothetical protein